MDDKLFKETVLKSLMRLLEDRLRDLEEYKRYNGRLDKVILETRNDLSRYKRMLEEMK